MNLTKAGLWAVFLILAFVVGTVLLKEFSEVCEAAFLFIKGNVDALHWNGVNNANGRKAAAQLIVVAVFVGWAASRFRNRG